MLCSIAINLVVATIEGIVGGFLLGAVLAICIRIGLLKESEE